MAGEEDDEAPAAAESSKANGVSSTNGTAAPAAVTAPAKEDPELAEMKAMAAEDGSAEESNTGM